MFAHGSRSRLTEKDFGRFSGATLFDRLARTVCRAGVLPRKELYEAWEVARRTRRLFRGGRVVDLAAGHGLLAHVMVLLDDSTPLAVAADAAVPPSAARLHQVLGDEWPRLRDRVSPITAAVADVPLDADDVVVSSHACGALTDLILDGAASVRARVAVLPCCHDVTNCDAGPLTGWLDVPLAIDVRRAARLEQRGYRVWTQRIPAAITPKNRLLLGAPRERS
ncbi:MAG: methyltransferase domain-containing protein [Acidobacteria bacterium]|nr:methyltransferase domain-containing protein [Acidobacteriota bacterium]